VPSERYEFTLCDERTPQIRCITCRRSATGALVIATGGHQLKLWTQSTAISEQPLYGTQCSLKPDISWYWLCIS